jgi:hypothetical protein
MQVLVGPAEVAGLEPVAVGQLPFAVVSDAPPYLVEGGGAIEYADVLTADWGSYEVTMDQQGTITGECSGDVLSLHVETTGSQITTVTAGGNTTQYPWEGSHSFDLQYPLEEGATVEGEGWAFVLHLNAP